MSGLAARSSRIVVVTGPPASGKSTLATRLADEFSLPALTKDGIKEAMLDAVGSVDRELSGRIGAAAWEVLWHVLEREAAAGRPVLVEGNVSRESGRALLGRLARLYDVRVLQVHCAAPVDVLYRRYEQRIGVRHPGHTDAERLPTLRQSLDPALYLLPIPGTLVSVDTTTFEAVDYERIRTAVAAHLGTA